MGHKMTPLPPRRLLSAQAGRKGQCRCPEVTERQWWPGSNLSAYVTRGSASLIGSQPGCEGLSRGAAPGPGLGVREAMSPPLSWLRGSSSSLLPTLGSESRSSITSGRLLAPTVYFVTQGKFLLSASVSHWVRTAAILARSPPRNVARIAMLFWSACRLDFYQFPIISGSPGPVSRPLRIGPVAVHEGLFPGFASCAPHANPPGFLLLVRFSHQPAEAQRVERTCPK